MCPPGRNIRRPYRNYMYTSYDDAPPAYDQENMWYLCFQAEMCPSTKRAHWQCYVEFKAPQRPAGAQKLLGGTGHFCVRSGTREQAIAYCRKEESAAPGSFEEHGDPARVDQGKTQGKRSDLDDIAEAIQDGSQPDDIADSHPKSYIRYHRGIRELYEAKQRRVERNWETPIHIIWGKPGLGKTRQVYAREGRANVYKKPRGEWWPNYKGQRAILIDDFVPGLYTIGEFLEWGDRYPCQVPYKGGFSNLSSRAIYITSNYDPISWWPASQATSVPAFERRVVETIHLEEPWEPESPTERDNDAGEALLELRRDARHQREQETSQSVPIDLTQDEDE